MKANLSQVVDHDLLDVNEAAAFLRVQVQTLAKWRHDKSQLIPYLKLGSRVLYRRGDLLAYLQSCLVGASAE